MKSIRSPILLSFSCLDKECLNFFLNLWKLIFSFFFSFLSLWFSGIFDNSLLKLYSLIYILLLSSSFFLFILSSSFSLLTTEIQSSSSLSYSSNEFISYKLSIEFNSSFSFILFSLFLLFSIIIIF